MFMQARERMRLMAVCVAGMVWVSCAMAQDAPNGQRAGRNRDNRQDRGPRGPRADGNNQNRGPGGPGRGFGGPGRGPGGRGPGGGGPGGMPDFGGMGRMLFRDPPITPEEREQFYDRVVQGYVERSSRYYGLNDQQKQQVKTQLDQVKAQQRQFTEPRMQQIEALRQQMRSLFQQARQTGQWDGPAMQQIGQQMRQYWEGSPLLNRQYVSEQIESLLPPEQAERGRAQRMEDQAQWQQRRNDMERRFAEAAPPQGAPGTQPANDGRPRRDRGDGSRPDGGRGGDDSERGLRGRDRGDRGPGRPGGSIVQVEPDPDEALSPWERYVRDFIRKYQLDASQQATVLSVLREAQEQRTLYENTKRTDYETARQIADASLRQKQLDWLNDPVKRMFEMLKKQVETVPTLAQRASAGTLPAAATQPAVATTQPAQRIREDRGFNRGNERRGGGGGPGGGPGDRPRPRDRGGRGE